MAINGRQRDPSPTAEEAWRGSYGQEQLVCRSDGDCPADHVCVQIGPNTSYCQPVETGGGDGDGGGCSNDSDCSPDLVCSSGECVDCISERHCPPGETCEGNDCVPLDPGDCIINDDCPSGQRCENGSCVERDTGDGGGQDALSAISLTDKQEPPSEATVGESVGAEATVTNSRSQAVDVTVVYNTAEAPSNTDPWQKETLTIPGNGSRNAWIWRTAQDPGRNTVGFGVWVGDTAVDHVLGVVEVMSGDGGTDDGGDTGDGGTDDGGDTGDGGSTGGCIYEKTGEPRSEYTYLGNYNPLFEEWRNCELSTDEFQTLTAPGQGTAALRGPGLDRGGAGDDSGTDTSPDALVVEYISIPASTPTRRGQTTVDYRVRNTGGSAVSGEFEVIVNGSIQQTTEVGPIDGGSTRSGSLQIDVPDQDLVQVEMGGLDFSRSTSDYLVGQRINVNPDPPIPGQDVTFSVSLQNAASESVSRQFQYVYQGQTQRTETVTFTPGERQSFEMTVTAQDQHMDARIGPATWGVEPRSDGGTGDPGDIGNGDGDPGDGNGGGTPGTPNFSLTASSVEVVGNDAICSYTVENAGDGSGTRRVEWTMDVQGDGTTEARDSNTHTLFAGDTASNRVSFHIGDLPDGAEVDFCPDIVV